METAFCGNGKMSELDKSMHSELQRIRQALEEHLNGINDNTQEIQSLFDYLQEMEIKLEKISQRMDQLQLGNSSATPITSKPAITPLNQMEKKVFLTLYTGEMALSYKEIAERTQLSCSVIPECISTLVGKGVPIVRNFCNDQILIKIEPGFKEMQAKENLVNLSLQSFME